MAEQDLVTITMKRLAVLYAVLAVLCASCVKRKLKPRPNIIFILADDLGWNDVGFNNPDIISPNIDGLARSGVILNQSYVQPTCTPSRAALLTGIYPFRLGLSHMVIRSGHGVCVPQDKTFLPQVLKKYGYSTHLVGKWHLGMCNWNCTPTHRGFDTFYGCYQGMEDYYTKMNGQGYDFRDGESVDFTGNTTHNSYLYRERIVKLITDHDSSSPLFLFASFQEIHAPLQVPSEYYNMYPNIKNNDRRIASALVSSMDATIGLMLQALKDRGLYDNTLIIFSSDNGGHVSHGGNNYPLRGAKASLFEGGTRAAAFVHGPILKKVGVRYDGLIHVIDWFPTILEAANIPNTVADIDGVSHWLSIKSLLPSNRTEFVYNLDYSPTPFQGKSAIRVGDYKLMLGFPGMFREWYDPSLIDEYGPDVRFLSTVIMDDATMDSDIVDKAMYGGGMKDEDFKFLFNLKDDPEERTNIYDQEPDIVLRLTERLGHYIAQYVTPNVPPKDPNSAPSNWGGVWTPGWC